MREATVNSRSDMVGLSSEGIGARSVGPVTGSVPPEVARLVLAGHIVLYGEYRFTKAESVNYKDKKSGADKVMNIARHTVEGASESYPVSEFLRDVKPEDYVSPFVKGERVLVKITGLTVEKGVVSIRGSLSKI